MAGEWTVRDKTCIVTGATSGIGEEIAIGLAREGGKVAIVARSRKRAEASIARISAATGAKVDLLLADLASQASIRALSGEILARYPQVPVLVNNAGVTYMRRETTPDGYETTFAVNHLAYYQLTMLLLERVRASAPARIVNVASDAHKFGGQLDFSDLQNERKFSGMKVYAQSKTANILFTRELARRLAGSGVTVNCIHPGAVATRLGQQNGRYAVLLTKALSPFFRTPKKGADTAVWLATAPEVEGKTGGYYYSRRERQPKPWASDPAAAAQLFEVSAKLVGV